MPNTNIITGPLKRIELGVQLSHGILLGVVGTDVALRELMRLAPRYKVSTHYILYSVSNQQS